MLDQLTYWITQNSFAISAVAILSMLLFAVSIVIAPWIVSRLPTDFLVNSPPRIRLSGSAGILIGITRNTIALFFLLLGLIMLVTPGPGIVMLLIAFSIARIPGKQAIIRRLASQKSVFSSLNWMRHRYQQPPLVHPDDT